MNILSINQEILWYRV